MGKALDTSQGRKSKNVRKRVRPQRDDEPRRPVIEGLDELTTELRRQGNNLNQLTVMARQGRIEFVDFKPFMEVYEKTWQALNSLASRAV